MARCFEYVVDELDALPEMKKKFESVLAVLVDDKQKMSKAIETIKLLIEERDKLVGEITPFKKDLAEEKVEKLKTVADAIRSSKFSVQKGKIGLTKRPCIKIQYLNLGMELRTRGMSTLCQIEEDKWFRVKGYSLVPDVQGKEKPQTSPMNPIPIKEVLEIDPESNKAKTTEEINAATTDQENAPK
ncbi:putative coiled-coil domain-containing protein [Sesbania bispinosa]|nr:putative coiled-coil domain-containing protein [Sesbania bispinosa]